jgi:hypothetical protein
VARDPNSDLYPAPGVPPDPEAWDQAVPGRGFTATALTLAAIATLIPLIPGGVGMIFAAQAKKRGDPLGQTALVLNAVAMGIGLVVAVLASDLAEQSAMVPIWWAQ